MSSVMRLEAVEILHNTPNRYWEKISEGRFFILSKERAYGF